MRGPDLVGYPPTGLRWAGDGSRLYFEWQARGEDEAGTWVVNADGSGLTRLTEEARRSAPPVNGQWDRARRRVLAATRGDIALFDQLFPLGHAYFGIADLVARQNVIALSAGISLRPHPALQAELAFHHFAQETPELLAPH